MTNERIKEIKQIRAHGPGATKEELLLAIDDLLAASQPGEPGKARCPKCGDDRLEAFPQVRPQGEPQLFSMYCFRCGQLGKDLGFCELGEFFLPSAPSPQPCEGCKTQSLDAFEHDRCFVDKVVCQEQTRWQKALYELSRNRAISPDEIDGSGCDSGDPLDVTVTEVSQVICQLENPQDYRVAPSGSAGPEPLEMPSHEQIKKLLGYGWKGFKLNDEDDLDFVIGQIRLAIMKCDALAGRARREPDPPAESVAEAKGHASICFAKTGKCECQPAETFVVEPAVVSASPSCNEVIRHLESCGKCTEAAAQPVASNPPKCGWPFKGECPHPVSCATFRRCLINPPEQQSGLADSPNDATVWSLLTNEALGLYHDDPAEFVRAIWREMHKAPGLADMQKVEEAALKIHQLKCDWKCPCHIVPREMTEGCSCAEEITDIAAILRSFFPVSQPPMEDHELGDPLWPIYQKFIENAPKPLPTYSGWLRTVAANLEKLAAVAPVSGNGTEPRDTESEFRAWMAKHSTTDYIGGELRSRAAVEFAESYTSQLRAEKEYWNKQSLKEYARAQDAEKKLAGAASHNGQGPLIHNALTLAKKCLWKVTLHAPGYDWNGDPLSLTLDIGKASQMIDKALAATAPNLGTLAAPPLEADRPQQEKVTHCVYCREPYVAGSLCMNRGLYQQCVPEASGQGATEEK